MQKNWNLNGDIDMETVALHELGHALGLRHSNVNNSVMEAVYEGERRNLTQDDRDGIRAIYGNWEHPIDGPRLICNTAQYVLDDFDCLNDAFTVTWVVSNNLTILNGQSSGAIEVESNIGFNGESGFIRAIIDSGCDELVYTKFVWIGRPGFPDFEIDIDPCRNLVRITDNNFNLNVGATYEFMVSMNCSGRKSFYFRNGHPLTLHLPFRESCIICIESVIISNNCGSTFDDRIQCIEAPDCKGFEEYRIKAYPNPATEVLTVELLEPEIIDFETGRYVIFNNQGKELLSLKAISKITTINLDTNFKKSDYLFLRYIAEDGYSNTEQIFFVK